MGIGNTTAASAICAVLTGARSPRSRAGEPASTTTAGDTRSRRSRRALEANARTGATRSACSRRRWARDRALVGVIVGGCRGGHPGRPRRLHHRRGRTRGCGAQPGVAPAADRRRIAPSSRATRSILETLGRGRRSTSTCGSGRGPVPRSRWALIKAAVRVRDGMATFESAAISGRAGEDPGERGRPDVAGIILVRHAPTAWTGSRYCGRSDPPLDAAGRGGRPATWPRELAPDAGGRHADRHEPAAPGDMRPPTAIARRSPGSATIDDRRALARGRLRDRRGAHLRGARRSGPTSPAGSATARPRSTGRTARRAAELARPGRGGLARSRRGRRRAVVVSHAGPLRIARRSRPGADPPTIAGSSRRRVECPTRVGRTRRLRAALGHRATRADQRRNAAVGEASDGLGRRFGRRRSLGYRGRPEPDDRHRRRQVRTAARAVSSARPSGSGIVTAQPRRRRGSPCRTRCRCRRRASPTERAQPSTAAMPGRGPEHPGPELRDPRRREQPRLGLVEDLTAEQRRILLHHRRAVCGRDQVRVASAAEHRERHPPDVPRRRRVRRVEVAVGIEPGDREPGVRSCRAQARHRAGMRRAVATDDEQPRSPSRPARPGRSPTRSRSRGRNSQIAARFLARGSGSGWNPGSIATSPASRTSTPARPGRARSISTSPSARKPAGVSSIPDRWPPSAVGTPTMAIGAAMSGMVPHHGSDAHLRIRPRALLRPLGVRCRVPAVRLRRPGRTRWRSCSRSLTTRPARCGTASSSATRSRPVIRCCGARSPRSTTRSSPTTS